MAKVDIKCNGVTSQVLLDGEDISKKATSVIFTHAAGGVPTIQVMYTVDEVRVIGDCGIKKINNPYLQEDC